MPPRPRAFRPCANDDAILAEFLRVIRTPDATRIEAQVISWHGPANPTSAWHVARQLAPAATDAEVDSALREVLQDRTFFAVCRRCGERNPQGWMGDTTCHGCMQQYEGVVF